MASTTDKATKQAIAEARRELVSAVKEARKKIWTDDRLNFLMPYPLYKVDTETRTVVFANAVEIRLLKTGRLRVRALHSEVPKDILKGSLETLASAWAAHLRHAYNEDLIATLFTRSAPCPSPEWEPVREALRRLDGLCWKNGVRLQQPALESWLKQRCPFSLSYLAGIKNIHAVGRLMRIEVSRMIEADPIYSQTKRTFNWWQPVRRLDPHAWNRLIAVTPLLLHLKGENKRLAVPYITSHCWRWLNGETKVTPACLSIPPRDAISGWRTRLLEKGLTAAAWRWITHLSSPQLMALVAMRTDHRDGVDNDGWRELIPVLNHIVAKQIPAQHMVKWVKDEWVPFGITNPRLALLHEATVLHRHEHRREIGADKEKRQAYDSKLREHLRSIKDYLTHGDGQRSPPEDVLRELGLEWPSPAYVNEGTHLVIPKGAGLKWFAKRSIAWHQKMEAVWAARGDIERRAHEHQYRDQIEARRQADEARAFATWESALPADVFDGYEVVPLTSAMALAEEGAEMHHCVSGYVDLCVSNSSRIFSIRHAGKRVATIEIGPTRSMHRYDVLQVRGKCNAEVDTKVRQVAGAVANAYTMAVQKMSAAAAKEFAKAVRRCERPPVPHPQAAELRVAM